MESVSTPSERRLAQTICFMADTCCFARERGVMVSCAWHSERQPRIRIPRMTHELLPEQARLLSTCRSLCFLRSIRAVFVEFVEIRMRGCCCCLFCST